MSPSGRTNTGAAPKKTDPKRAVDKPDAAASSLDIGLKEKREKITPKSLKDEQLRHEMEKSQAKNSTLLNAWGANIGHDRKLKTMVAKIILSLLVIEVVLGNIALFLIGFKYKGFELPTWVAETFFVGMYVQIISIVLIVVKNLFPQVKGDHQSELNKMVEKM